MFYLYIKTHNKTGLKYLGKTNQNPYRYKGSGKYWLRHLSKHGSNFTTQILKECETNDEIKKWGIYYSALWNVVESKDWANIVPEIGNGNDHLYKAKATLGKRAYNNGTKTVYATEQPDGYKPGMLYHPKPTKHKIVETYDLILEGPPAIFTYKMVVESKGTTKRCWIY